MTELLVLNIVKSAMQAVRMTPAGAEVRTLVDGLDETPDGIVVDPGRRHIYWTNMGRPDEGTKSVDKTFYTKNGSMERVDFDGTNRVTILPRGTFTTGKQLTADFADGKLYWCDREGMQVLRCDLDGSNVEPVVIVATGEEAARHPRNHPVGVAVDPATRTIYWTQKGAPKSGEGRIFRAPIDRAPGTTADERTDLELLWDELPEPIDLDLDGTGRLVWTDRGAPPDGNSLNRAQVVPEVREREVCARDFKEAIGMASNDGITYYVGDLAEGHIRVIELGGGTDREAIVLGPGLTGLALADI